MAVVRPLSLPKFHTRNLTRSWADCCLATAYFTSTVISVLSRCDNSLIGHLIAKELCFFVLIPQLVLFNY